MIKGKFMKKKYLVIGIGIIFIIVMVSFVLLIKTVLWGRHMSFSESVSIQPPECSVKSVEQIHKGMYPKWSSTKNFIAFNDWDGGTADIYTMRPDRTDLICLTCDNKPEGVAGLFRHAGQPFWHPSGEYILFTAENSHSEPHEENMDKMPGIGHNHDIWIMASDGKNYWRITNNPPDWGVIRPSFSYDGTMIYWNEEYSCERATCPKPRPNHPNGECCSFWSLSGKTRNAKGEEWAIASAKQIYLF